MTNKKEKVTMFKRIILSSALITVIGVLIFGAITPALAQTINDDQQGRPGGNGRSRGTGQGVGVRGNSTGRQVNTPPTIAGDLSAEESAALLYMREEEKLAHDVYATLYAQWGLPVFQNISRSEQAHTDAVKALLDRYGLADPASSQAGVFSDPGLQALYNDLTAQGGQSLVEALKVGVAIEEIDILDLKNDLAQIDNPDIQQVFNNLLQGSYNHLNAFVASLSAQTGETYQPQYLSPEDYQSIIDAGIQAGGIGNGGRGGGNRGGR